MLLLVPYLRGALWRAVKIFLRWDVRKINNKRKFLADEKKKMRGSARRKRCSYSPEEDVARKCPDFVCVPHGRYMCVYFLPIYSGRQVRWMYQPGSHRRKVTQDFEVTN